jgi:uncharacterized protein YndB with AHSA1/START domain
MAGKNDTSNTADREIVGERLLDAPRELVWAAWTDPKHVAQWWGPNGFTNTIHEMDVRAGGVWRFMMHGPDGKDWPNRVSFIEVERPSRLVYDHGDDAKPDQFQVTVTFEEAAGGKTKLTMRSLFKTKAERDFVIEKVGAIDGMNQTLGRLAQHLPDMPDFVVTRLLDAPRPLVWKAWTDAAALAQWWGPKTFDVGVLKQELRPGGHFHYSMKTPQGQMMWGRFVYQEISPPERLSYVSSFADKNGDLAPNPWLPDFPLELSNVLTLTEENGRTRLTLVASPIKADEAQVVAFVGLRTSMQGGYAGTFEQLEAYLRAVS